MKKYEGNKKKYEGNTKKYVGNLKECVEGSGTWKNSERSPEARLEKHETLPLYITFIFLAWPIYAAPYSCQLPLMS